MCKDSSDTVAREPYFSTLLRSSHRAALVTGSKRSYAELDSARAPYGVGETSPSLWQAMPAIRRLIYDKQGNY